MPQVLELHELPTDIRAHFLAMPGFQQAMKITKSTSANTTTVATVTKTLKTSRHQHVKKAAYLPPFAQIVDFHAKLTHHFHRILTHPGS